jgi:hypothetical protein
MGTLNYSTTVDSSKTAGEMSALLSKHGASRVTVTFEEERHVGLEFTLVTPHGDREFALPINVDAVNQLLERQYRTRKIQRRYASYEQAERTAWRVAKVWLEAQLALIEAAMASLDEVMLPYLLYDEDSQRKTLYARYREAEESALALTTGKKTDG